MSSTTSASTPTLPSSMTPSQGPLTMTPHTMEARPARPAHVQTNGLPSGTQHAHMPTSALSASSVGSSSRQESPIMSPDANAVTNNSSIQASPEPFRGREMDDHVPAGAFQLPEPVLNRKTSNNSLPQSFTSSPSMTEPLSSKGGLIRRLSNRATRSFARRRPSSAAPNSRDGSVGPGILRRRSDSNNTAPPEFPLIMGSDSEDDSVDEFDELRSLVLDGTLRESTTNSTTASVAGSSTPSGSAAGPVIPFQLVKGTQIRKVSSKKKGVKKVTLVLEPEAGKISWDKARPQKTLYIDDIKDLRVGSDIRQYRLDSGLAEHEEARWFSIWYVGPDSRKSKMMHVITDDATSFHNWVTTLEAISKHRHNLMASLMAFDERALKEYWKIEMTRQYADKPHSADEEELDFAGVLEVCRKLHIHAAPSQIRSKFQAADTTNTGRLNSFEFHSFVNMLKQRDDIREIYQRIASRPEAGLTCDEFLSFLRNVQREDVDTDLPAWEAVFSRYSRKFRHKEPSAQSEPLGMGEPAFVAYLTSTCNVPLVTQPKEYRLDRPMNEYFISSSHNTYLLGRQVAGLSTIEGYIAALVRGCRCVEVDCWDGADGQPTVNHGRTLTSSISFKEAIVTINKYAFQKSPYPLWISLEVHCSPPQQEIMTAIIKETFGARLITTPLDPTSDKLPSPEELRGKVLIKVKKPQMKDDYSGRRRGNSLTSPYIKPVPLDNGAIPSQSLPQSPLLSPSASSRRLVSKSRVNTITEGEVHETLSSSTSENESSGERGQSKRSSNKTTKVLGDLGVYCAGVKFTGFDTPDAKAYNHIFSFMESSFEKHSRSKDSKKAMDRHNMRYLMRVYPDRYRYNSTNFDPLIYWRRGVQMAALNWQTYDLGMQLNQAMFEGGTDQSGYVLKPSELREIQVMPGGWSGKRERKEVSFTIDVISAQQLMRPNNMPANRTVDPYVEVEVFHSNDKRDKKEADSKLPPRMTDSPLKYCTRVRGENGFNPIFDNRFNFKVTTKYPDLIFVRFSVKMSPNGEAYSDKAQPVATYTAKLSALKEGYRTLPLFDPNGDQYMFSTLFCNIKKDSINSVLLECADDQPDTSGKLRGLGRTIFNRSNNISPKSSMEKTSFDSS